MEMACCQANRPGVRATGVVLAMCSAWAALLPAAGIGQSRPAPPPVVVFLSPHVANLPTATTLRAGALQFEISHRFGVISDGADGLWGIDGPVNNRLGLSYAPNDRLTFGIVRSDLADNLDFSGKVRVAAARVGSLPLAAAVKGGFALNTQLPELAGIDGNEAQWYAQLILNTRLGDDLAVGVAPGVVGNAAIQSVDEETALHLGLYAQYYLNRRVSLLGEWVASEEVAGASFDSGTAGIEMRVGGHFFKLIVTNQQALNPTQFLIGSAAKFEADNLRFGFNITRRF